MFEPRIVAFLCSWCSYTGADTAGIARLKSPANLRAIRVPCSGRVSPELIMRTFDQGADGVLVLGCHIGECHYDTGNHRAAKRLPLLQSLLAFVGLEPDRLRLDWVSASEGERFARITNEFTAKVRELGPVHWRLEESWGRRPGWVPGPAPERLPYPDTNLGPLEQDLRTKCRELLVSGQVSSVIGYEISPRGRTRPAFIEVPEEVDHLVWNADCGQNLSGFLMERLAVKPQREPDETVPKMRVAVVVKPCDSRTINVLLAENQVKREQVHIIGMACNGVRDGRARLQDRCATCRERLPVVYDDLIGEMDPQKVPNQPGVGSALISELDQATPAERLEFWVSQFDRCIRCYACRQACPLCNCPTCLYERDDSTYIGLGIGLNEKRTFHLGRAFHLAGRCVGCDECERACPMEIPISLLNQKLSEEIEKTFKYRAGLTIASSPIVTILSGEYKED